VIGDAGQLLIDPGVTIARIKKALGFKVSDVSACLCSHAHGDHSKAIHDIVKMGIDVYVTDETARELGLNGHRVHIIEPGKQFKIAGFQIVAFPTQHDCPGSVGFLIADKTDKLVFATDTFYLKPLFKGLTIIAVECNYSEETLMPGINPVLLERIRSSHFSLANVREFFKKNDLAKVREIHLLHLSRDNADPGYFRAEIEKLTGKPVYIGGHK
jgi:phosphoribosyl 1,2-cyclic phosphodiesterase